MTIAIRPLTPADAAEQCAGEDELTVRWLTGGYGDVDGTAEYIADLIARGEAGAGKRAFGVTDSGRLCGYIDYDPDLDDGIEPGSVNISYTVYPWARGRGIAVEAVALVCDLISREQVGDRVAIRVEPENLRSVRVALKAGFTYQHDFSSSHARHPDGTPVNFSLYLLDL